MSLLRCYLLFLGALLLGGEVHAAQVNLLVQDYPPYIDRQADNKGMMTELVVKAFARVDVPATVIFKEWGQVEQAIDERKGFSFMWTKSKPLLKKWWYSNAIYQQKKQFLAKNSFTRNLSHLHDLRTISIGLVKGRTYGTAFENYRHKLKLTEHVSDYANIKSLLDNSQQLAVVDPMVAVYLANQFFKSEQKQPLKFVDSPHFDTTAFYLVCGKRYGNCLNYIKKFNRGWQLLESDGTAAAFFKQAESL